MIKKFWQKYGFEISLICSIIFMLILAYVNRRRKGAYDSFVIIPPKPKRRPPQESKGELECRRVLENIFNKPFNKARPNILRNPVTSDEYNSDINLELDCYNEELKIACEYNGIQHYKFNKMFHKNKDAFMNQKYRDHLKREMCLKNNIKLIEVPYTVKHEDIENFIRQKL